ncbi:bifunctional glycosyltransferase family 2/GtrA family protein [Brachybacterium sp. J144]|uniref:bifunctional glycosyltransferase family 2/GtrA family protein n=1 Tax=Brachybacterium sp. J144 TaxID=3116487 RepID=UPI002E796EE5|nr:bifunctional glycosyltransferase family 2/GtrA family protein [Brachybacterium sp. J144]MEE1650084.1 bifunctional glycosyltransferase family 2/GtrA family protein [Brachybacterium sp. J144]
MSILHRTRLSVRPSALPVPAPGGVVVVIPALAPGPELLELVGALAALGVDGVVVDDGSGPDHAVTFDACEVLGARVLRLPENRGKGAALRAALDLVRAELPGRCVVTADADGQHSLLDVLRVATAVVAPTADGAPAIVLGVRSFTGPEVPLRSRLGNVVSSWAFEAVAGVRLGDTQTGLRGIPATLLDWAGTVPGDRYEYEYALLVAAARRGIPLREVTIATLYVDENATSHFRPVRDSLRVLAPVLAFAGSGLAAFALDTGLFLALAGLGAPVWLALAIARLISAGTNFALNRHVVFRGGRRVPLGRALARYAGLAAGVLLADIALVSALHAVGVPLLGAKIAADLLLSALSYAVQRVVVFRQR